MRLILALILLPGFANAQCLPHPELAKTLHGLGEQRRFIALGDNGGVVELYVAPDGAWTLTATGPSGVACIVAHGQSGDVLPAGVLG